MTAPNQNGVLEETHKWLSGNIETRLFIDNEFVPSQSGKKFDVVNPATEKVTASVFEAEAADVDRAVQAAKTAFPSWSALSGFQRAVYFYNLADLVEKSNPDFAKLEAVSMGKPVGKYSMSRANPKSYSGIHLTNILKPKALIFRALSDIWPVKPSM